MIVAAFVAFAATSGAAPATAADTYRGVWALSTQRTNLSATLHLARTGPLSANLDISEERDGALVRDYALDMTKRMHLIVIDDDFTTFAHDHPVLGADGHLRLALSVPKPGRYLIYADATPAGAGQTVFRFAVSFGTAADRGTDAALSPSGSRVAAGPYSVTLNPVRFPAATTTSLAVRIGEGGEPAVDLRPYLGGAAHAVFINTATLAYLHVHPMTGTHDDMQMGSGAGEMGAMDEPALPASARVPASMTLHVGKLDPGRYKLWLQFRGSGGLEVAPFVITATR